MTVTFELNGVHLTGTVTAVDELQNRIDVQTEDGGNYNLEAYTVEVL